MINKNARRATTSLLILSVLLALFVAFNDSSDSVRFSMYGYIAAAGIIILLINGVKNMEWGLIGGVFTPDIVVGFFAGVGVIVLNSFNNIVSLGAPQALISLGDVGLFISLVLIAPIVEELLFRGVAYPFLYNLFGKRNIIAIPSQAAVFALFHWKVYGGFLGVGSSGGLFVGAFLFGIIAALLVMNSPKTADITTLERPMVAHMLFNFWLLNATLGLVTII